MVMSIEVAVRDFKGEEADGKENNMSKHRGMLRGQQARSVFVDWCACIVQRALRSEWIGHARRLSH